MKTLSKGEILAGRFRVQSVLGTGGMATVYQVTDLALERTNPQQATKAAKVLKSSLVNAHHAAERLRREGALLQHLSHPNLVRTETYGELDDGRVFVVMEHLEGKTLREYLSETGPLPLHTALGFGIAICNGLQAAHEAGVIHRDLKPENIFIVPPQNSQEHEHPTPLLKLLDFGIAKAFDRERLTHTGQFLGTPRYMAPEQLQDDTQVTPQTDVYAVGIVLYEMLAGTPPFTGRTATDALASILSGQVEPLHQHRPDLPQPLVDLVLTAMARIPDVRPKSASLLKRSLQQLLPAPTQAHNRNQEPARTGPMGTVPHPSEHPAQHTVQPTVQPASTQAQATFDSLPFQATQEQPRPESKPTRPEQGSPAPQRNALPATVASKPQRPNDPSIPLDLQTVRRSTQNRTIRPRTNLLGTILLGTGITLLTAGAVFAALKLIARFL